MAQMMIKSNGTPENDANTLCIFLTLVTTRLSNSPQMRMNSNLALRQRPQARKP